MLPLGKAEKMYEESLLFFFTIARESAMILRKFSLLKTEINMQITSRSSSIVCFGCCRSLLCLW